YAEFAFLNRFEDLGLVLPRPDAVFTKATWAEMGVKTDGVFGNNVPSLDQMKLKSGKNAWEDYRQRVYEGRASKDTRKKLTNQDIYVEAKEGENFEEATRRTIETEAYRNMTPENRAEIWKALHGIFKDAAKDHLKANLVITT